MSGPLEEEGIDCIICKIFILLEVVRFMGKVEASNGRNLCPLSHSIKTCMYKIGGFVSTLHKGTEILL